MCILKILSIKNVLWSLANTTVFLLLLAEQAHGKPQDILVGMATNAVMGFQQGAAIIANGGLISHGHDLDAPFAKVSSKTEIGAGEAMIRRDNSDSSEEDRKRRKRSLNDIMGDESLRQHMHHIFKRSPCGQGSTGEATQDVVDGDIDVVERRRRARMRKAAAAKKKRNNSSRKAKKSKIVSDVDQSLTRRKRQSEPEDFSASVNTAGKDFAQRAQQLAENVRSIWDGFINSLNQMAQNIKQKFSENNPTAEDI